MRAMQNLATETCCIQVWNYMPGVWLYSQCRIFKINVCVSNVILFDEYLEVFEVFQQQLSRLLLVGRVVYSSLI